MFKWFMLLIYLFRAYGALLYADLGGNVTLPCFYPHSAKNLCWYKQIAGEQPQIISSVYAYERSYNELYNQFKDDTRLSFDIDAGSYKLKISNVRDSDSAMYFCGETKVKVTTFSNGTFLAVKDTAPVWVYVVAALLLSVIVNIALICALCKMAHRPYLHSGDSQQSVAVYTTETQNEPSGDLQYVALDYRMRQNKSRRQRSREEETVYSEVRKTEQE
ncbi:hypothetical protein INR49_027960 [Caranx melampygus]|nr:hypothetical protein INR49_027960 [Caranx melampygus]